MGMFDYIKIDKKLAHYFENISYDIIVNEFWQTKSLDNCLRDYIITENALLIKDHNGNFVNSNFHGIIRFYSQDLETNREFKAKYTDGKLINIIEVEKDEE